MHARVGLPGSSSVSRRACPGSCCPFNLGPRMNTQDPVLRPTALSQGQLDLQLEADSPPAKPAQISGFTLSLQSHGTRTNTHIASLVWGVSPAI